ncbi:MAG: BrnT family toxin [Phycisphaerae bacterium]|nr:BrnT family toxin [Phycisphaerae bacterium]
MKFEFDPDKSKINKTKHGIDFVQAQLLWQDHWIEARLPFEGEDRFLVVGRIGKNCYSAIVTYRGDVIRVISVRRSRRNEKELYDGA